MRIESRERNYGTTTAMTNQEAVVAAEDEVEEEVAEVAAGMSRSKGTKTQPWQASSTKARSL